MTGQAVALAKHAMAAGICSACGMKQSRVTQFMDREAENSLRLGPEGAQKH